MNIEEIKRLCPEFAWVLYAYPEITKQNAIRIVQALAEARQALGRYGRHGDCKKADFDYKPCTCGLEELLPTPPSVKEG